MYARSNIQIAVFGVHKVLPNDLQPSRALKQVQGEFCSGYSLDSLYFGYGSVHHVLSY